MWRGAGAHMPCWYLRIVRSALQCSSTYLLVKGLNYNVRLNPQFVFKDATTCLVLCQCGSTLAAIGQCTHRLSMGLLAPGLERQLTQGKAVHCCKIAARLAHRGK